MKIIEAYNLRYADINPELLDVFPERWGRRREFSLYKHSPRPCSALFFINADVDATFCFGKSRLSAKKGDVVFIPEGSVYHAFISGAEQEAEGDAHTYTLNLNIYGEGGERILLSDSISVISHRQDLSFETGLKHLSDTIRRIEGTGDGASFDRIKVKAELLYLLDAISRSGSEGSDYYYPIRRGIEAFCDEWNRNERIEKYAELCGVSVTYFYRCFRKWSGSSPLEYRNSVRLANAEGLIRCTDMRIGEISSSVGYEDPFYFCRLFSEKYGASPSKYRKSFRSR